MGKAYVWRRLGKDVADVVASSPSESAAARTLGIDRSTLHRWRKAGKVGRPGAREKRSTATTVTAAATDPAPAAWAQAVLEEYELTATELRLLDLAVQTLTLAQDTTLTPQERLAATGRYQMLVKQLRLEDVNGEEEKAPHGDVRPFRRIG